MKLPKFIKASTHQERQQKLMTSNRQLMLTDTIFKLQPTKQPGLFRDILNQNCKVNSSEEWPNTPSTPLYQIKTNKLNESAVLSKNFGTQNSGRYVKSAQTKRLQRNFYNAKNNQSEVNYSLNQQSTPLTCRLVTPKIDRFVSGSEFKARKSVGSIISPLPNTSPDLSMDVDQLANLENQFAQYNNSIYKSYEQFKQMEAKINQDITSARNKKNRCQPSAGVTGSLLKQIKKNQNLESNILVASVLIKNPIVFNTQENSPPICAEKIPFICESSGNKLSRTKIRSLF